MTIGICRSLSNRNISFLHQSASNQSVISDAEWIVNGISFLIFLLALLGNTAALLVMFASRGPIRLTNNKYLANLACADLLRACFIPFTVIARMKRNFIFGWLICKILPVVQGLSVAVDVFTLVCISIERYLAICRPLLIMKLQSLHCSYLLNGLVLFSIWFSGLLIAFPNLFIHNLCFLPNLRRFKCEKNAPEEFDERVYIIILDVFYLLLPMAIMILLYSLIIAKMSRKNTAMRMRSIQNTSSSKSHSNNSSSSVKTTGCQVSHHLSVSKSDDSKRIQSRKFLFFRAAFHRNNQRNSFSMTRMDRHRRKALKLLIVLIISFFVCWTPLYIYHTIGIFKKDFYRSKSNAFLDFILLLSFASASCNPITYYFMSQRYRAVLYSNLSLLCFKKNSSKISRKKNLTSPPCNQSVPANQLRTSLEKGPIPVGISEPIKVEQPS